MQAVIFMGLQASGKSSYYRAGFADSHIRINLDMLRTRHRENLFLECCLEAKQAFVIDNTNPTKEDRQRYILKAKAADFKVIGYHFISDLKSCLERNMQRPRPIPEVALKSTHQKFESPDYAEGFDHLNAVYIASDGSCVVTPYKP